ncbi:hypothetical protein Cs7R123_22130 [Catellatospora sp. TT07R-123]|nr:hypothetical protein Cs7R123_22130 [Catellatospora sp. TT07R-123]
MLSLVRVGRAVPPAQIGPHALTPRGGAARHLRGVVGVVGFVRLTVVIDRHREIVADGVPTITRRLARLARARPAPAPIRLRFQGNRAIPGWCGCAFPEGTASREGCAGHRREGAEGVMRVTIWPESLRTPANQEEGSVTGGVGLRRVVMGTVSCSMHSHVRGSRHGADPLSRRTPGSRTPGAPDVRSVDERVRQWNHHWVTLNIHPTEQQST